MLLKDNVCFPLPFSKAYNMIEPYEVRAAAGKGEGVFATEALRCGDIIMYDVDKMVIEGHDADEEDVTRAFEALGASDKEKYMKLYPGHLKLDSTIHRIWRVNCFEVGGEECGIASCIRLKLAKINHSCVPNADWLEETSAGFPSIRLLALRDISKGEEILISYNDELTRAMDTSNRRSWLYRCFGFWCCCDACASVKSALHDTRRRIIFALAALKQQQSPPTYLNAYKFRSQISDSSACEHLMSRPDFYTTTAYDYLLATFLEAEDLVGFDAAAAWKSAAVKLYNQISPAENGIICLGQVKTFLVWLARAKQRKLDLLWSDHPTAEAFLEDEGAMLEDEVIQVAVDFLKRQRDRNTGAVTQRQEEHFAITFKVEADGISTCFPINEQECDKLLWKHRRDPSLKQEASRAFWKYVDQKGFRLTLT
ncbi:putative protein lysine methyltransferase SET5 [Pseudocercospora fuligena]|uniref:SET domain-containing protein n=1 Tax=Pseudocercospora fuligena TaxID=685502 RepID=A0A8H6VI16_9PEZI|nr:putative protein lysine methyltransferase SET5 [Pseudocercospora fuligena]